LSNDRESVKMHFQKKKKCLKYLIEREILIYNIRINSFTGWFLSCISYLVGKTKSFSLFIIKCSLHVYMS